MAIIGEEVWFFHSRLADMRMLFQIPAQDGFVRNQSSIFYTIHMGTYFLRDVVAAFWNPIIIK